MNNQCLTIFCRIRPVSDLLGRHFDLKWPPKSTKVSKLHSASILHSNDGSDTINHRCFAIFALFDLYLTSWVTILAFNDLSRLQKYHILIQYRFCFRMRYNKLWFPLLFINIPIPVIFWPVVTYRAVICGWRYIYQKMRQKLNFLNLVLVFAADCGTAFYHQKTRNLTIFEYIFFEYFFLYFFWKKIFRVVIVEARRQRFINKNLFPPRPWDTASVSWIFKKTSSNNLMKNLPKNCENEIETA